jgi:multiple sugar transport system permease protein
MNASKRMNWVIGWPVPKLHLTPRVLEAIGGYLFLLPWIVGFITLFGGPVIASLGLSLFRTDLLNEATFVGLQQYQILMGDPLVGKALFNTAYYSFVSVPLSTVMALSIAIILNQGIRFQGLWRTIYYIPSVVSGVAVSVLWMWLFQPDVGLLNALLAMVGIDGPRWIYSEEWAIPSMILMGLWGSGGSMLIFLAGLRNIPTALYEAAEIDGAGPFLRFWHITVPMLTPTILFSIVMGIIGSFQIFTQAYIMTSGGPNNATLTVILHLYNKAFKQFRMGYGAALAWVLFAILLILTLLTIRSSTWWVFYAGEKRL